MPVFPRTIKPRRSSTPLMPAPMISIGKSGPVNTRAGTRRGRTWEEHFLFKFDEDGKEFIAQMQNYYRNGTVMDVQHQDYLAQLGGATSLTVNGADQTGATITVTPGGSTPYLKAGDLITFASDNCVYDITADFSSTSMGINPPIFTGNSPATSSTVTRTATVVFKAVIQQLDLPTFGPNNFVAPRILWREAP